MERSVSIQYAMIVVPAYTETIVGVLQPSWSRYIVSPTQKIDRPT